MYTTPPLSLPHSCGCVPYQSPFVVLLMSPVLLRSLLLCLQRFDDTFVPRPVSFYGFVPRTMVQETAAEPVSPLSQLSGPLQNRSAPRFEPAPVRGAKKRRFLHGRAQQNSGPLPLCGNGSDLKSHAASHLTSLVFPVRLGACVSRLSHRSFTPLVSVRPAPPALCNLFLTDSFPSQVSSCAHELCRITATCRFPIIRQSILRQPGGGSDTALFAGVRQNQAILLFGTIKAPLAHHVPPSRLAPSFAVRFHTLHIAGTAPVHRRQHPQIQKSASRFRQPLLRPRAAALQSRTIFFHVTLHTPPSHRAL